MTTIIKPIILSATLAATTIVAALAATVPAQAHERAGPGYSRHSTATPVIDQRQAFQQAQIARGRRIGTLTWREYRMLKAEQVRIATQEARAKSDGRVDRWERRGLWQALDMAERNIHRATQNGRNRFGWWLRRSGF